MKIFRSATAITLLSFAVAFLSLLTLAGVRFVQAAWAPPTAAPPGGNVAAPINVSGTSQTKQGNLTIGGEYLSVSGGDLLFASDDRGVFWADSTDNTKPHIESAGGILYLSPGENAGSGTEIQGDLKISTLGVAAPNPGSLTIENSQNGRQLTFNLETGAVGVDIKTDTAPLFVNYDSGQKVQIGSSVSPIEFCLNDDPANPIPGRCITSLGGGGLWTQLGNFLYPNNLAWNVGIGTAGPNNKLTLIGGALTIGNNYVLGAGLGIGDTGTQSQITITDEGSYARVQSFNGILSINPLGNNVGINTIAPNQELGLSGDLAMSGGIYKLNGTTKFFADTCAGANLSIKTINADGSVTCEVDDGGGGGSYTAENGLTLNGNAFGLGGTLVRGTLITQGNFSYTHDLNGSGDFMVQDGGVTRFEVRDNGGIYLSGIANCNGGSTLDTDANGQIICGTDDTGGGSGDSLWNGTEGVSIYPKTPASTRVAIGHSTFGDSTQLSVKNNSGNSTIYSEQQNAAGYAGYFSGKTVVMNGNVGIGIAGPTAKLHVVGGLLSTAGPSGDNWFPFTTGNVYIRSPISYITNTIQAENSNWLIPSSGNAYFNQGNVGIGTPTPVYKLDVVDTMRLVAAGRTDGVLTEHTGVGNYRTGMLSTGLYQIRANRIGLVTPEGGSADRLFIDASGNIKIPYLANCNGNSTVDADANGNLICGADASGSGGDDLGNHTAQQNLRMNNFYISNDGGDEGIKIDNAGRVAIRNTPSGSGEYFQIREPGGSEWAGFDYDGTGNNLNIAVHAGSQVQTFQIDYDDPVFSFDTASVADALVIQKAGNVGVGTSSPGAKLDIAAAASGTALQIGTNNATEITLSGGSGANIAAPSSNLYLLAGAGLGLHLGSNNTNSQVVLTNGNLGIGTGSPNERLEINGNIRGNQNGAVRVQTASGYLDVGSQNASYAHFYTDRDRFYFNKRIVVDGGFSSYSNNNLVLETGETARLTIRGNGAGGDAGKVGIANTAPDGLLAIASGGTPFNAFHTLTSYNNSTTAYNSVSGFKSGANIRGSGVYGGLVAGTTCAGSSICAGIYGSDGSSSYPVLNGTWAGYFNGDVNVADQLNVNTAIYTNTLQATNINVANMSGFTLNGNILIGGKQPVVIRRWEFLGGTQGDLAQDTGVHSNNYTCYVSGYHDYFDVQEDDQRHWEFYTYTAASSKWGGTTWWIRMNYANHNQQEAPYKVVTTCIHNFLANYQVWTGCQANTDSGWSGCSGPGGGGY